MDDDYSYVPTGEAEDWTYEGLKVYDHMKYFQDRNTFVETFLTEDGFECFYELPRQEWTEEIKKLAKEKGML